MPDQPGEVDQLRGRVESLDAQLTQLQERVRVLEDENASKKANDPAQPFKARVPTETRFGLAAVNRIGAFTLAIGIVFFFKYAVDNEWIGARGRVLAGLLSGLLLIAAAEVLSRRNERTFLQGIAGCGIATCYISVYAAFAYYKLISQNVGYVAMAAVCGLAMAVSLRYSNQAIAALAFLGGLLTPLLLRDSATAAAGDLIYLFLLDLTCVLLAVRQNWLLLAPGIAATMLFAGWLLFGSHDTGGLALFAFALAALHAGATTRLSARPSLRNVLYLTGNGCLIVAVLRQLQLWLGHNVSLVNRSSVTSEINSTFLGLYGVIALTYGMARASAVNRALGLFLMGLVIAKLYLWDVWFLERFYRTTAFVSLGVLLLGASWIYSRWKPRPRN